MKLKKTLGVNVIRKMLISTQTHFQYKELSIKDLHSTCSIWVAGTQRTLVFEKTVLKSNINYLTPQS
jgi:hypothetical protein